MTKKRDIFFGRQPAIEVLGSDRPVEKVLLQKGASGPELTELRKICKERGIPVQSVPKEKINYLLFPLYQGKKVNHQGVVGFYGMVKYFQVEDILSSVLDRGEFALFVILDGVTDIRNIGAIARTALCMNAHALIIPNKGVASLNADALKASAGALNHLPVCRTDNLGSTIQNLKLHGIQIFGASVNGKKQLPELDLNLPCAVVLGSEGAGMSDEIEKSCDDRFRIPMNDKLDSLNVGVSAGMILYEAFRQRSSQ